MRARAHPRGLFRSVRRAHEDAGVRAHEVIEALRRRFSIDGGEWLFFTEAWRIDAYAIRCWPSGPGYMRVACEVKCSRGDFLLELRKPGKRQNALDLSHEFYFVTPKGLVTKDEVPPECGLMYVENGRTRIVKRAPQRTPRAFKLSEMIYLCRTPLYRDGILEMRRMMRAAESHTDWAMGRNDRLDEELRAAQERLVSMAGHLVVKGSMWRGRWAPNSWTPPEYGVDCYVEEFREFDRGAQILTLRRLDNGDAWRYVHVEDVLTHFEPLDVAAIACGRWCWGGGRG